MEPATELACSRGQHLMVKNFSYRHQESKWFTSKSTKIEAVRQIAAENNHLRNLREKVAVSRMLSEYRIR
jgi:hypothetical protein